MALNPNLFSTFAQPAMLNINNTQFNQGFYQNPYVNIQPPSYGLANPSYNNQNVINGPAFIPMMTNPIMSNAPIMQPTIQVMPNIQMIPMGIPVVMMTQPNQVQQNKHIIQVYCAGYTPESIKINYYEKQLFVHAKNTVKQDEMNYTEDEFENVYILPDEADKTKISSYMTPEGNLLIEMPLQAPKPEQANQTQPSHTTEVKSNQNATGIQTNQTSQIKRHKQRKEFKKQKPKPKVDENLDDIPLPKEAEPAK